MLFFKKIEWTAHSEIKMKQYGLSKSKLMRLLQKPERKEQGIVPGTMAVMETKKIFSNIKTAPVVVGKKPLRPPGEIWLMYKDAKNTRRIISAWRYPGISKPGEEIPIPKEIRDELLNS
ncbi:MAG: hypothetical protein Q7S10_01815 [bacterium]|nr:hypothetical protein [bacterium]